MLFMTVIDAFMVFSELAGAFFALHFDDYSRRGQAFIISASVFLAGLWLVNIFTGNNNSVINYMIMGLSLAVIIVLNWHDYRKRRKVRNKIKVLEMTPLQRQKYERDKKAVQKKRKNRKANRKVNGVPEPN